MRVEHQDQRIKGRRVIQEKREAALGNVHAFDRKIVFRLGKRTASTDRPDPLLAVKIVPPTGPPFVMFRIALV